MFICVEFQPADPNARLPRLGTTHSAAYDIYSVNDVELTPNTITQIDSGLVIDYISPNIYIQILSRSGLALNRSILTCAGVIDPDYRGRIFVLLNNISTEKQIIKKGERIAQMVFMPIIRPFSNSIRQQLFESN